MFWGSDSRRGLYFAKVIGVGLGLCFSIELDPGLSYVGPRALVAGARVAGPFSMIFFYLLASNAVM